LRQKGKCIPYYTFLFVQTSDEFLATMGVFSPTLMNRLSCQEYERRKDVKDLPKSVDWRKDGYVSDVKEQVIINNTETPPI